MIAKKDNDQYTEQEAQRRFEKLLRSAINTPPKPLKSMGAKRPVKRKQRAKSAG